MNKKSKISKLAYITENLEFAGALFFFYEPVFLWKYFEESSIYFLFSLLGLLSIESINIFLNMKKRSGGSLFFNTVISYGILTGIIYCRMVPILVITSIIVGIVPTVIYKIFMKVHCHKLLGGYKRYRQMLRNRIRLCARVNIGIASIILISILAIKIFSGNIIAIYKEDDSRVTDATEYESIIENFKNNYDNSKTNKALKETSEEKYTLEKYIEDNFDELKVFMYEEWNQADFEARIKALKILVEILRKELLLDDEIKLDTVFLGYFSTVSAYYLDDEKTICINQLRICSDNYEGVGGNQGLGLISTICHESYHALEYKICLALPKEIYNEEIYDICGFEKIRQYSYELVPENYINGEEDFEGYSNQVIELDANAYADKKAHQIYTAIQSIYDTAALSTYTS